MRSVFSISIFLISILISTIDAAQAQQVQVHQDGSYLIQAPFEGWTFEGQVETLTAKIASENIRKPNLSGPTGTMVTAIP